MPRADGSLLLRRVKRVEKVISRCLLFAPRRYPKRREDRVTNGKAHSGPELPCCDAARRAAGTQYRAQRQVGIG